MSNDSMKRRLDGKMDIKSRHFSCQNFAKVVFRERERVGITMVQKMWKPGEPKPKQEKKKRKKDDVEASKPSPIADSAEPQKKVN